MKLSDQQILTVDLFCEVIDNYGDAGVCWRLARQLATERHCQVRLWIDQLSVLQKICPWVQMGIDQQCVDAVDIYRWKDNLSSKEIGAVPDIVIEGFGTRLPDNYVKQMAERKVAPIWMNLEYLSAESWVESMHRMPSPHPQLPLTKYFYFPGFTEKTGGLIREKNLIETRTIFQADRKNAIQFLSSIGVVCHKEQLIISIFCYPTAPLVQLLEQFANMNRDILCLIPEGVASQTLEQFMGKAPIARTRFFKQSLEVQIFPVLEQRQYDRLLWSCDWNFVRGEDSFVRAQWASLPFVWQIYPQEEQVHIDKLNAFLALYLQGMPDNIQTCVKDFWYQWNGCANPREFKDALENLMNVLPQLKQYAFFWQKKLTKQCDLSTALFRFIEALR